MPQEEKSIIRSIISPTIELDDMIFEDAYTGTSEKLPENLQDKKTGRQYHLEVGTDYPQITINSYTFNQEEMNKVQIDATGFLPKLYLKVVLTNSAAFKSNGIPKDGDIVSIFIRAKNDAFKPIRNDYIVTSVNGGKGTREGMGGSLEIYGDLFIPRMLDENKKAYTGTSFEVLQTICQDLNLGFATNENFTDDEQIWINPNDTYQKYIQKIVKHAWKDESSFFSCFIDVYYHLNFLNVNNQIDSDGTIDAAIVDTSAFKDFLSDSKQEERNQAQSAKLLSDMDNFKGTNMYIKQYRVENNSLDVVKDWGYKSYVQFFDQASGQPWEIFVDPITTPGAEEKKILLKGRSTIKAADGTSKEKWWETQNRYFWRGIQYRDVHDKYLYSEIWNARNNSELEKLFIEVDIERWNPNIYRGERLPVILHTQSDNAKRSLDATPDDQQKPKTENVAAMDQFYSGYYMVDGMKFIYSMTPKSTDFSNSPNKKKSEPGMTQSFKLTRREWPVPGGPPNEEPSFTN
jgi:hypothetical protein